MAAKTGDLSEARAAERRAAMAPSTMRARNLDATDVTVVDLSQTGIRIETPVELAVGEEISIGLSGVGARRAYVAWRRDGHYGCAFEQPLVPGEQSAAFTSVSVVRLGMPQEIAAVAQAAPKAERQELYGHQSLWRMPADAVLVTLAYLLLSGWLVWHFLLAR